MASPNFDSLSVQHSKNIGDPVVAATTDGKVWTSAQRSFHLNLACKDWLNARMRAAFAIERRGLDAEEQWSAMGSYVQESSSTALTGNALAFTALTPNILRPIALYNVSSSVPIRRLTSQKLRFMTSSGGNSFLTASSTQQFFTVDASSIRVLGSGATDNVYVRYVAAHTDLSAGGASDILVLAPYWGDILRLAFAIAKRDVATAEAQQIAIIETKFVTDGINQG